MLADLLRPLFGNVTVPRQVVLDEAPTALRQALALMAYTGLGPKDALALPRNFVRDGEIATTRSKHGGFPPAGHQNLAETLHIRKSASRDPAAVAPRTQTFWRLLGYRRRAPGDGAG